MAGRGEVEGFGPGKVILLGEHAVVYGFPALAGPLSIGVRAVGERLPPDRAASLKMPRGLRGRSRALLVEAFGAAVRESSATSVRVKLESTLPTGMGLGSSAAVSVACARALLKAARLDSGAAVSEPATKDVARVAWEMERVFHGTPSGLDHSCSAMGELIHFRRRPAQKVPAVTPVSSPKPLNVLVWLLGERPPTKETVAALRGRQMAWPERYARIFREIGRLADDGRRAVEAGELAWLGDLMNMNHGLLSGLGLSSAAIDEAVHRLRAAGALGAKLTGSGGDGGAVIGLFEDPGPVAAKLRRQGVDCFVSQLAGPTLRGRT